MDYYMQKEVALFCTKRRQFVVEKKSRVLHTVLYDSRDSGDEEVVPEDYQISDIPDLQTEQMVGSAVSQCDKKNCEVTTVVSKST